MGRIARDLKQGERHEDGDSIKMWMSKRHRKESTSEEWRLRALRSVVALFAALMVSLTLAAAASADVSFTKAYGWGVSDGASHFETCTSGCEAGIAGAGAGQLFFSLSDYPAAGGVATDPSGDVYVADIGIDRIDEFSAAGAFIKAYGWGVSDGASHVETCTSSCQVGVAGGGAGEFNFIDLTEFAAGGVATDPSGDVYVADSGNQRIDEFSAAGAFIKAYGWGVLDGMSHFETCTSTCKAGLAGSGAGQLDYPTDVATDSSGDVYVVDIYNNRIDEFSAAGAFIKAYGWGVSDGASHVETCTSSCQAGIAGGGAGQLYFSLESAAGGGVATDPSGDVYVADYDNNRIDEFSAAGAFIKSYGWGVSDGASQFETCTSSCQAGIAGGAAGQLYDPDGIATDPSGDVYVADIANQRIDEFSAAGAFIKAYGWSVLGDGGQFETCTSSCQAGIAGGGAGQLYDPDGVATDPSGDVYVADYGNNRIDEFSGSVAAGTPTQGPPISSTVTDGAGYSGQVILAEGPPTSAPATGGACYSGQLTVTNANGTVSDTETASLGLSDFAVSPTVAVTHSSTLTPGSAAFTASAVASSDTQCSAELAPESLSADSDAQRAGLFCMKKPPPLTGWAGAKGPTPETHPLTEWFCNLFDEVAVADYDSSQDPPDPSFGVVFQPNPFAVPALGRTCPPLRGASCRRLRVAELGYLRALADVASLSEAVGVTANRFGGAKDAGDIYAESLQGVAEAKYLTLQASAVSGLQQAGRRLGTVLRSDHVNTVFSAKQVAQGRKQLRTLDGIPRSLVTGLERDGLITSREDLERIIASLLKKAPRARATTLAQLLEM